MGAAMRPRALVALLAVAASAAGCLSSSHDGNGSPSPAPSPLGMPAPACDFAHAIVDAHDHADPALHTASCAMDLVGYTDMSEASDVGTPGGGFIDVSLAGHYAFVSNWAPGRSLSIVDVSDPQRPRHVSDFSAFPPQDVAHAGASSHWDVSAFPEGDLVVLPSQASTSAQGDAEGASPNGGGVFLVDTEDKESPYLESFTPIFDPSALVPVGVHNANALEVAGERYVAATTANGQTILLHVEGEAGHRTLKEVSRVPGEHDTTVQRHPFTNQTLLYGCNGAFIITDISDPAKPEIVSTTPTGANLTCYHQAVPSDVLIDGRHYTVTTTESSQGVPVPLTILDTTDPAAPAVVGHWTIPVALRALAGPYGFSPHNLVFEHGRLYIGHYHAGVWVVDVSTPERIRDPVNLGFYQPHHLPPTLPRTPLGADVPAVWGVQYAHGLIYAADVNTGLYILAYTGPPSPLEDAPEYPTNLH